MATDLAEEAQAQATVDIPVAAEMDLLTAERDRMVLEADVDADDPMVCLAKNMMTKMNVSCSSETEYERKVAEVVEELVGNLKSFGIPATKHENNVIDLKTAVEKMATDLAEEAQAQATVDIPVAAEMELLTAEMDRMSLEADVVNAVTARAQMNVAHIDLERDLAKRALDSFHNRLDSTYIYIYITILDVLDFVDCVVSC